MSSSSSFFPSSSSSSMTNETTKLSQIRKTLFQKASSLKATSLARRQETVFKKAKELSILCGIDVCVIYYGSDGELQTWPKDREKVKDMALRYSQLSVMKRSKKQYDLEKFLEEMDKDDSKKKNKKVKLGSGYKYPDWDPRFDNYSVEQLTELIDSLERKLPIMQDRHRAVLESQRQESMRYMNMADQEQMQMNHLQEHSDQVSSALLQLSASTSGFNQDQSLAPIPNALTVYQYPDMDMYSSLLGVQDTGMNEFLSMDVLPYNSFNTNMFPDQFNQNGPKVDDYSVFPQETGINNMNVEDYSGWLWGQGSGINGLQNMDMYGYNNNNGFSDQLVQLPAQSAAPVCQYMDGSTQDISPHYEI